MHAAEADIDERLTEIERRQNEVDAKIEDTRRRLLDAFPAGDTEGHRRYHELQMEMLAERRKLVAAVKEKTIAGLVWAGMLGLGLACWQYVKSQVLMR